jgi:hypothetical protein
MHPQTPGFPALDARAAERNAHSRAVFLENYGNRLLGVPANREP